MATVITSYNTLNTLQIFTRYRNNNDEFMIYELEFTIYSKKLILGDKKQFNGVTRIVRSNNKISVSEKVIQELIIFFSSSVLKFLRGASSYGVLLGLGMGVLVLIFANPKDDAWYLIIIGVISLFSYLFSEYTYRFCTNYYPNRFKWHTLNDTEMVKHKKQILDLLHDNNLEYKLY